MKKMTLSSCLTKSILTVLGVLAFIYGFSCLFPRAYNVLEARVLGIEEDTTAVVKPKVDTTKVDTTNVRKLVQVPNEYSLMIKLERENNCYLIPTKINGIPMKMLLDTGASNLTLSVVEYEFLRKQKLISDTVVRESQATIANGQTVRCYEIKIATVEIGHKVLKDVDCSVMEQQDAPLLLGMNVLRELGNVSIDYQRDYLCFK